MKRAKQPTSQYEALREFVEYGPSDEDGNERDAGTLALTVRSGEKVPYEYKTFGELICSPDGFALLTASPAQRAIQTAVEGLGVTDKQWADPNVRQAFGNARPKVGQRPEEFYLVSGIRCGKSLHAAGMAIHMALTCDMRQTSGIVLGPGETPRVSIISLSKDTARPTFQHLVGNIMAVPALRNRLLLDPSSDGVELLHPLGRPVEIKVVSGARSGATLVARWSAGVIFDEAPRMLGQESGIVNLDDMRSAVRFRLLRGSQIWYVGSPAQPRGPVYDAVNDYHGKPSTRILVVKATSDMMNPEQWTPAVVKDAYAADPELAGRELGANFTEAKRMMFDATCIDKSRREYPLILPYDSELTYSAAIDPATRGNAWTLCIFTKEGEKLRMVYNQEWRGGDSPLNPDHVLKEIAEVVHSYGLMEVLSDQWSVDALNQLAMKHGMFVTEETLQGKKRVNLYKSFMLRLHGDMIELSPDAQVAQDFKGVEQKETIDGMRPVLTKGKDGRHCDYVPSAVLAAAQYLDTFVPEQDKTAVDALNSAVLNDDDEALEELEAGLFDEEMEEYGIFFG